MSYKEVLRNLSASEQRNADRFREIESVRLAEDRERGRERLAALSDFSDTLDGFVKTTSPCPFEIKKTGTLDKAV